LTITIERSKYKIAILIVIRFAYGLFLRVMVWWRNDKKYYIAKSYLFR